MHWRGDELLLIFGDWGGLLNSLIFIKLFYCFQHIFIFFCLKFVHIFMFLVLSQFQSDRQSHLQSSCWSRGGGSAGNKWNKIENNIWIVGCDSSQGSANVCLSICMYVTLYVRQYVCMSYFLWLYKSYDLHGLHGLCGRPLIKIEPPTWVEFIKVAAPSSSRLVLVAQLLKQMNQTILSCEQQLEQFVIFYWISDTAQHNFAAL